MKYLFLICLSNLVMGMAAQASTASCTEAIQTSTKLIKLYTSLIYSCREPGTSPEIYQGYARLARRTEELAPKAEASCFVECSDNPDVAEICPLTKFFTPPSACL